MTSIGERARQVVLGATVRTLGAWPSGWRYPGAHHDPAGDPALLLELARSAERAHLDFLFFGDWLATDPAFERTDPYLLARVEPFAAISYLSAVTEHIGLIATVNSSYAEPYAIARSSASADLLSNGRVGINIATGAEIRSARNFGWQDVAPLAERLEAAGEVTHIVRGLWDSWEDDAFVADQGTGVLIDAAKVHALDYVGRRRASSGPLNVVRPPQGHPPIAMASSSPEARDLALAHADVLLVSPTTFDSAVAEYAAVGGRLTVLAPVMPIVAATREQAWDIYDELVALLEFDLEAEGWERTLASVLGAPITGIAFDDPVPARVVARFGDLGRALVQTVYGRSGREVRADRPLTYRHLYVATQVKAPVIVGNPRDIADYIEAWFSGGAVDGFTVLSAFLPRQFDDFLELVVPELVARGLFRADYDATTLRGHLGLPRVPHPSAERIHAAVR
jgi:FMN-dependent oxidoreductase (nitrilotriacetate monooxygenase family)